MYNNFIKRKNRAFKQGKPFWASEHLATLAQKLFSLKILTAGLCGRKKRNRDNAAKSFIIFLPPGTANFRGSGQLQAARHTRNWHKLTQIQNKSDDGNNTARWSEPMKNDDLRF